MNNYEITEEKFELSQVLKEKMSRILITGHVLGATVTIMKVTMDNKIIFEKDIPASYAVFLISVDNIENGTAIKSAKILWNDVCSRDWDTSI